MSKQTQQNKASITVEIEYDEIQEAVEHSVKNITSSSFNNPVRDCVKRAFEKKEGEIEEIVTNIISKSLSDPKFQEQIGEIVLKSIAQSVLKP